jgi:triacylglycerol lipase
MNQKIQRLLLIVQLLCGVLNAWLLHRYAQPLTGWACIVLGFLLSFTFQFWLIGTDIVLSRIHQGSRQSIALPQLSKPSIVDIAMAWLRESWDCIRVFSFMQVFNVNKPIAQPGHENPNSGQIPVLLLHGFFCNRALWHPFAARLARRGHVCSAISMEPAFGSIDEYAQPVARAIADLKHRTGAKQVALIGHSMGGLAIRSYLRRYGNTDVAKAISLGTPHAGTWLGKMAHSPNGQEMNWNSLWLKRLAEHEVTHPVGQLFTVIMTDLDNIVFPQLQQTLPGAENIAVSGMAHISMVFDDGVFKIVSERLAT